MGKCQTDPSSKVNIIKMGYAGVTLCCPTLCCPACSGAPARISQNLDLFLIYFEIEGFEISIKSEIHSSPLRYQGSLPREDRSQKVVNSIGFSWFSVRNIAFRLGKIDILCFSALSGMSFDHFKIWHRKKDIEKPFVFNTFFDLRIYDQRIPIQKLVFCARGRRLFSKTYRFARTGA